jgi:hypothetical protein
LEKNAKTIVLAFLYEKLKKNAGNNDSGGFICTIEKKCHSYSSTIFIFKIEKKMLKL